MKKSFAAAMLVVPMLLTSCGQVTSEAQTKLSTIITDMSCLAQFGVSASESASGADFDMVSFRSKMDGMSKDLETLMKGSFAKEADMDTAYNAIADKVAFKKEVATKALAKCQAKQDTVDKVFAEIDKNVSK